ncbi:hypothetical protein P168DRAFT_330002 [Aspergillus campestris IBT 28561]|uniref:Uncharacterized protein n=1 Tax=Aspergillus campestris (strain IBT 28561) TaxID=1392248 RepID=A0A2I1CUL5_ASPC2|nr:uncharacterized protein P168DRAFT_330002 [Aspergillus campestris IBT 28561]PKY01305.1 hypothetical protein P168DRAFT_330002 [Aspergillus campestris IBT 28561]
MPIKLPKGFARRKSAGNVLDEGDAPQHSSFRVIERPSADRKSFSDGNALSKRMSDGQLLRTPTEDQENIFAGQDHLHPRNSGAVHEGSRFNSSTRRSTDGPTADSPHSRSLYDIPIPPLSGALRAAGRTFSFGGRFSKAAAPPQPLTPAPSRHRAMTNSTSSTATPPRLMETDLQIGSMGDDFNIDFSKRDKSRESSSRVAMAEGSANPAPGPRTDNRSPRPTPIDTSRSKEVEPSPYSWDSKHSEEGLLATSYSPHDVSSADRPGFTQSPSYGERRKSLPLATAMPSTTSHRALDKPQGGVDKGLRRSVMFSSKRDDEDVEDDDAKLIMQSLYRRNSEVPLTFDHDGSDHENDAPLFSNDRAAAVDHAEPRASQSGGAHHSSGVAESHLDHSIAANARLAAQYEKTKPPGATSTKVMTPSQFEHYRQQKELKRSNSDASKSENSEDSELDEEDEVEKGREVERQRRRQEAHLSVYRQQMMKVTGQQLAAPPLRPELDRASNSAPNLATPALNPGSKSASGKSSEGDEDEEIPLGILAAHGFPNRNRPPSRLAPSNSIPNMRASYHHQPYVSSPGSGVEQDSSNRFSLPVFARNLPRDPYYGAGLVNPPNRESLAFGGGASVYGGPTAAVGPSPGLPPGGLVGVIATEERARAMRRGSPNMQAMHEYQAGMPAASAHPSGVPRPYTMMNMTPPNLAGPPPAISASEQAQIELSQQMSSMMQMQMQWMQQMIQMQGGQGPAQSPMSSGGLPFPPGFNPAMLPPSMPSPGPFHDASPGYPTNQRTLSMLDPNVSSRLNSAPMPYNPMAHRPHTPAGQGYAPSIAPSERSNVGLAPRYRPVSTMQAEAATSADASLPRQWNDENQKSFLSVASPAASRLAQRPISSGSKSAASVQGNRVRQDEDEDEDEGWADMMKKREKKRDNWKLKKETNGFGDLLNAVH